jgi:hypothetical protein
VRRAVRRDDEPDADTGREARVGRGVEYGVDHFVQSAELGGVAGRVDLQLDPTRALCRLVGAHLGDHARDDGRAVDLSSGRVVQMLELRPRPAGDRGAQVQRCRLPETVRQRGPALRGEVEQSRVTHPASEVQVQVRLRQP